MNVIRLPEQSSGFQRMAELCFRSLVLPLNSGTCRWSSAPAWTREKPAAATLAMEILRWMNREEFTSLSSDGGTFVLVMSSDFKNRLFLGRVNSAGSGAGVSARILAGQTKPNMVFGGTYNGTGTQYLKNAVQSTSGGDREGFFSVKVAMPLP